MSAPLALTALGIATPLGVGRAATATALFAGSRAGLVERQGLLAGRTVIVGAVTVALPPARPAITDCRTNRLMQLALDDIAAPIHAAVRRFGADRIAVVLGTSTAGIAEGGAALAAFRRDGAWPPGFSYEQQELGNLAAHAAAYLGLTGVAYTIATACSSGAKVFASPSVLDAYAQVRFSDMFYLSAGSILLPLTRNGTQPTTTYVSIDNANIDVTPILQGNSTVIRDVGVQGSGFFLDDHLEYRVGLFQGSRAAAVSVTAGTPPVTKVTQTAGHNFPRFVSYLQYNFWDTEKGYVNGGHYYGTKKVLGVQANFDYQGLGNGDPPKPGTDKDPYIGASAAAFINYPLSGAGDAKKGGDEIVFTAQFGYYDGGGSSGPNLPTYAAVLRQTNYLLEGGYYNRDLKMSFFGKFETRKIQPNLYSADVKARNNNNWYAVGMKYYFAPANLANIAVQYERIQFPDAPSTLQGGTNNITVQMQTLLY